MLKEVDKNSDELVSLEEYRGIYTLYMVPVLASCMQQAKLRTTCTDWHLMSLLEWPEWLGISDMIRLVHASQG